MKKIKSFLHFFSFLFLFSLLTNSGFTQWQWLWPLPQGINLNSVSFLNENSGLFAGQRGVILKTTNSGLNYTNMNLGFNYNLGACIFVDDNLCFAGGDFSRIYKSTNSGINWSFTSIESNNGINEIFFVNSQTGWASALYNNLYKTTNSGLNWSHSILPYISTVNSIYFKNSLTGFAGGNAIRFKLIKTTDGGITWGRTNYDHQQNINSVFFSDSLNGYLGCVNSKIYKTTDGGNIWFSVSDSNIQGDVKSIRFIENTGFSILDNGNIQRIFKSTNSGLNWNEVYYDSLVKLTSISFKNQNVVVTGTSGRIIKSTDLGLNWLSNKANILRGFSYIKFINENTGIAVGGGYTGSFIRTYRTSDGGQNWIVYSNSSNVNSVFSIYFVDLNTGYLVGGNSNIYGKLYKTTNCGSVWIELPPPLNKVMYDVEFINDQTGIVCGLQGLLAKTTNGAINWSVTNSGGPELNSCLCFIDIVNCYSGSSGGDIYKTTNGGNTWIVSANIGGNSIEDISFVNGQTGFVATSNGVFKTNNGGFNWDIISSSGTFHNLDFYDMNTGFVSSYNGRIYRTTTGGSTWTDQSYISSGLNYSSYKFITPDIVYMLGSNMLFKTTNGGVLTDIVTNPIDQIKSYSLFQNFPNPFNPVTVIKYHLPSDQFVNVKVYNILGKQIQLLQNNYKKAGFHEVKFDGRDLPGGIYFYNIETPEFSESRKMILLK